MKAPGPIHVNCFEPPFPGQFRIIGYSKWLAGSAGRLPKGKGEGARPVDDAGSPPPVGKRGRHPSFRTPDLCAYSLLPERDDKNRRLVLDKRKYAFQYFDIKKRFSIIGI